MGTRKEVAWVHECDCCGTAERTDSDCPPETWSTFAPPADVGEDMEEQIACDVCADEIRSTISKLIVRASSTEPTP